MSQKQKCHLVVWLHYRGSTSASTVVIVHRRQCCIVGCGCLHLLLTSC
jgi:hypothetical protein